MIGGSARTEATVVSEGFIEYRQRELATNL
jgi:hypothetical protein